MKHHLTAPASLPALIERVQALSGQTIGELAQQVGLALPEQLITHKGLVGQLVEYLLGTDAGNQSKPDFLGLGIELKTIPVNAQRRPKESTYVCTVPLNQRPFERFETSVVQAKLAHVLWVPLLTDAPLVAHWTILDPVFWQPNEEQWMILRTDFEELMDAIALGGLETITSRMGEALHIRPKAADGKQLTSFFGEDGSLGQTLPRGFYLRTGFTGGILQLKK
ncbi:MAG: DNA mismatch repair endonuclease MutH [Gammaproteobacteria bacterium]